MDSVKAPIGPQTRARRAAYDKRRSELVTRNRMTDGVGSFMVEGVRAQTVQNEYDRATRAGGGAGGQGPTNPNTRLTTFGIKVEPALNGHGYDLVGGTARQRACYLRAVKRHMRATA